MSCAKAGQGTVQYGRLKEFAEAVGSFIEYRRKQNWALPEVLYGLAGAMNTVLMIFRYDNLDAWDREAKAERQDADYGRIASRLPYAEPSIHYERYQDDSD